MITTKAVVHSYSEGDSVVNVKLANGDDVQAKVHGATVELIDDNGSSHTHRLTDIEHAREVFGVVGTEIEITYAATNIPQDVRPAWAEPELSEAQQEALDNPPEPEPAPAPEGAASVE